MLELLVFTFEATRFVFEGCRSWNKQTHNSWKFENE